MDINPIKPPPNAMPTNIDSITMPKAIRILFLLSKV
jgi:hypothetical protein